ncbi:glycosyltransferase family 39 protein [Nodosilinea sp. LEGE 07088]|uniref:ArnT family glycosyltransferase n=1 Tax=Nodosilinea sp. LEGE 07088 TaxID=2777968 RepID=UPI00187E26A7|nr:glycosyltransferase family 39 protein [Nodosilinea sp. LEGE 07088]MBE9140845.1 glycosyltransferase family 39 protein [Nodosilinea sp. LEGE 07088]
MRSSALFSPPADKSLGDSRAIAYLLLLVWMGVLLLSTNGEQSLMAFDEGNFAAEARFMVESGNWLARQWWGQPVYTHGIALNWLMASSYVLFGQGDWAARLPSIVTAIGASLLTYEIGRTVLPNRPMALVGALILAIMPLWFQYGRLATQDMPLVFLELLGIWALLQAETFPRYRFFWGLLAGTVLGLGFLMKSFMILLPSVALLPYLIGQQRRHRHLTNLGLYLGLLIGLTAVGLWILLSVRLYGDSVLPALFGKIAELSDQPFHSDANALYYFWNIPANAFPWPLFTLIACLIGWRRPRPDLFGRRSPYGLLLWGYPFVLAGLLTLFPTRTPYYALQLYPFMALLAAIAMAALTQPPWRRIGQILSDSFGILGWVLVIVALISIVGIPGVSLPSEAQTYQYLALILGTGLGLLPYWWRVKSGEQPYTWIAGWLLPIWLTIAVAGFSGLLGNYAPDLKAALQSPDVYAQLADQPVDFVVEPQFDGPTHQTWVLLTVYTPQLGSLKQATADLAPNHYAWVSPNLDLATAPPHRVVTQIRQWHLIQTR